MARDEGNLLQRLEAKGVSRRDFLQVCAAAAAAVGLPSSAAAKMAEAALAKRRPSVIWLHFQECTGCSESLLRTAHPALAELVLDLISLDYHETLLAAAGYQAEDALKKAMTENDGKYVCVIEGAIPVKDNGIYCMIGGRTAIDIANDVASKAAAVIAIGSCASWGGLASSAPNPTGATGAPEVLKGKTVVTIPGCPPNPYNLLGTVLQFVALGTLPALDSLNRPSFAYARVIHDDCPRRPHFDAGRFAERFGDDGHRQGWCLYKLGCKGPATHASCSLKHFGEVEGAWPIGIGHPCFGCTEKGVGFSIALHDTVPVSHPMPPDAFAAIHEDHGGVSPLATGIAGVVGGLAIGAGLAASKRLAKEDAPKSGSGEEGR